MRRARWWAALAAVAAIVCLGGGLAWAAASPHAPSPPLQVSLAGAPFTSDPVGPLFVADGLAPGRSAVVVLGVRVGSAPEVLSLQLLPTADDDALAPATRFDLEVGAAPDGPFRSVWSGGTGSFAAGVRTGVSVGRGADRWVRLTATVPAASGNEVAGATLRFGLRVQVAAIGGSGVEGVSVGGAGQSGHGVEGVSAGPVSVTGAPLLLLVTGGVLLGGAGGGLLWIAGRSRSS